MQEYEKKRSQKDRAVGRPFAPRAPPPPPEGWARGRRHGVATKLFDFTIVVCEFACEFDVLVRFLYIKMFLSYLKVCCLVNRILFKKLILDPKRAKFNQNICFNAS